MFRIVQLQESSLQRNNQLTLLTYNKRKGNWRSIQRN